MNKNKRSYIYFIRCHDFVKIGIATNPKNRCSYLQVGCPYQLKLIGAIPGGEEEERRLHLAFEPLNVGCEWFNIPEVDGKLEIIEKWLKDDEETTPRIGLVRQYEAGRKRGEGLTPSFQATHEKPDHVEEALSLIRLVGRPVQQIRGRGRGRKREIDVTRYKGRFSARLRELRSNFFLRQSDFCDALDDIGLEVSLRTISDWESGVLFPNPEHLPYIADALGLSVSDLFPVQ